MGDPSRCAPGQAQCRAYGVGRGLLSRDGGRRGDRDSSGNEPRYRDILAGRGGADVGMKDLVVPEHRRVRVGPATMVGKRSGGIEQAADRKYDLSSAANCPTAGADPRITVNGRLTTPPDTAATVPKCPVPPGQAMPQSIGLSRAAWPPTARSWTCSRPTRLRIRASSYAGIAGPGPTAKASERILSARYQLLPKKDAATRLIPPGIMDHASRRKFLNRSSSTEATGRGDKGRSSGHYLPRRRRPVRVHHLDPHVGEPTTSTSFPRT